MCEGYLVAGGARNVLIGTVITTTRHCVYVFIQIRNAVATGFGPHAGADLLLSTAVAALSTGPT